MGGECDHALPQSDLLAQSLACERGPRSRPYEHSHRQLERTQPAAYRRLTPGTALARSLPGDSIEGTRLRNPGLEGVVIKRQATASARHHRPQSFGVGVEQGRCIAQDRAHEAARGDVRRAKLYYLVDRIGKRARSASAAPSDRRSPSSELLLRTGDRRDPAHGRRGRDRGDRRAGAGRPRIRSREPRETVQETTEHAAEAAEASGDAQPDTGQYQV